jgi:hypothetical protein
MTTINWFMLLKEIPVYSKNHTKPINTACGQNAELVNVKAGGSSCLLPLGFKGFNENQR